MSSTMNPPRPITPATRATAALFSVTVVLFLLAGLAIVVGQAALLVGGAATAARSWAETMTPYAFGGASAAGILAFLLTYAADDGPSDSDDD